MKKLFIISTLAICAVAAIAIILILNSSFQTKLANSILAKNFGGSAVENVSLGMGEISLKKLKLKLPDSYDISVETFNLKYSLLSLLSKNVDIEDLLIDGVEIVQAPSQAKTDGGAKLPKAEYKNSANQAAEGKQASSQAAKAPSTQKSSSALDALREWSISVMHADAKNVKITQGGETFNLFVKIDNLRCQKNLALRSYILELGADAKFLGDKSVLLLSSASAEADDIALKLMLSTTAKNQKSKVFELLSAKGKIRADYSSGKAEIQSKFKSEQLEEFAKVFSGFPQFSSDFYLNVEFANFAKDASARLLAKNSVAKIAQVPELKNAGVNADISIQKKGDVFNVEKFDIFLSENSSNVISVSAAKAFEFTKNDFSKIPEGELLKIGVNGLNPKLVNGIVPNLKVEGSQIIGAITISTKGGDIEVKTTKPFGFYNLSVSKDSETLLKNFNAKLSADAKILQSGIIEPSLALEILGKSDKNLVLKTIGKIEKENLDFDIKLNGSLNPLIEKIDSLSAAREDDLNADLAVKINLNGKQLLVSNLVAKINDAKNNLLLSLKQEASPIINLSPFSYKIPDGKILSIATQDIPFALIKPFAGGVDGDVIRANADISFNSLNKICTLNADIGGKSFYMRNKNGMLFRDINFNIVSTSRVNIENFSIEFDLGELSLTESKSPFATLSGKVKVADKKLNEATFKSAIALPRLLMQPSLRNVANIMTGLLDLDGTFKNNKLDLNLKLSNFKAVGVNGAIETLNSQTAATFISDIFAGDFSQIDLKSQLSTHSTNGSSSAALALNLAKNIKLNLDAKCLVYEDIEVLSAAFKKSEASQDNLIDEAKDNAKQEQATGKRKLVRPQAAQGNIASKKPSADSFAKRDSVAIWNFGKNLTADLKLGEFKMSRQTMLKNASAHIDVTPEKLALSKFSMEIFGAKAASDISINFGNKLAVPYYIKNAKASVKDFEISEIFADKSNPLMTGSFNFDLILNGQGNNLPHLLQFLTFTANVKNTGGGVLKIIDTNSVAGATTAAASVAMKIAGGILGNRVKELDGLSELTSMFVKIDYSSVGAKISRNSKNYDFNIDSVIVNTPKFLMRSTNGKIYFDTEKNIMKMNMDIPIQILVANRGLITLFKKINYCNTESDIKTYYEGPTFEVTGTPSAPKNNLLEVLTGGGSKSKSKSSLLNLFK